MLIKKIVITVWVCLVVFIAYGVSIDCAGAGIVIECEGG